ncbi:reverse transcriptase domain-containing protein [Tanacetum coccineum]
MPFSTYPNLGLSELAHTRLTVELADRTVKYPKGIIENVLVGIENFTFPVDFIILDMPKDIRVPLILTRPFFSTAHAKINVYKRKITLRVGEEKIIFKSVKPASSIIKRVYMLSLRERMELDLEARLMGETLVINRSLDSFLKDYIELNDLNEPFELRRNQGNDLMPTIKEGEVIEDFRTRNEDLDTGIDDYPILENMDAYRDEGMGDVIYGKPFLREVDITAKWFEGKITLYKGDDEVTYQMVRSHPRFKHPSNEQWNKIPPLLKLNEKDVMNGISHAHQKLKGFYKGVLNLGPDYIRNAKTEEWLTRGHISVHEVLYKVEDIATFLVKYVKFWDDWEVDHYGNANLVFIELIGKGIAKGRFWSIKCVTPSPTETPRRTMLSEEWVVEPLKMMSAFFYPFFDMNYALAQLDNRFLSLSLSTARGPWFDFNANGFIPSRSRNPLPDPVTQTADTHDLDLQNTNSTAATIDISSYPETSAHRPLTPVSICPS